MASYERIPTPVNAVPVRDVISWVRNIPTAELPKWAADALVACKIGVHRGKDDKPVLRIAGEDGDAEANLEDMLIMSPEGNLYSSEQRAFFNTHRSVT